MWDLSIYNFYLLLSHFLDSLGAGKNDSQVRDQTTWSRHFAYGIIIYYTTCVWNLSWIATYVLSVLVSKILDSLDSLKLARHCWVIIRGIIPHNNHFYIIGLLYMVSLRTLQLSKGNHYNTEVHNRGSKSFLL